MALGTRFTTILHISSTKLLSYVGTVKNFCVQKQCPDVLVVGVDERAMEGHVQPEAVGPRHDLELGPRRDSW